jgi:hypothetical protein
MMEVEVFAFIKRLEAPTVPIGLSVEERNMEIIN